LIKIFVPYDDREKVEQLGAIKSKSPFYLVPDSKDIFTFAYWNRPAIHPVINGEDRTFGNNWLYVDLIPSTCWYTNVRSNIDSVDWERLKEMCRQRARYCCEICGATSDYSQQQYLECHERYLFDKNTKMQKIIRFMCICSMCHKVSHFGLSQVQGKSEEALQHLMKVNRWDKYRARKHVDKRFQLWEMKSDMDWVLDLSLLDSIGIKQVE